MEFWFAYTGTCTSVEVQSEVSEADYSEVSIAEGEDGDEFGTTPEKTEPETAEQAPDPANERDEKISSILEYADVLGEACFSLILKKIIGSSKKKWPSGFSLKDLDTVLTVCKKKGEE